MMTAVARQCLLAQKTCSDAVSAASEHLSSLAWERLLKLLTMFATFFKVGAFTFGGGYAMIPLIKAELVEQKQWLDEDEFLETIGITQSVPGAVAVNMAVYLGYKVSGSAGALLCAAGVILPSFIIILIIAASFAAFQSSEHVVNLLRGIRPAVVVLIFSSAASLSQKVITRPLIGVFATVGLAALVFGGAHPIAVLVIGGALGAFLFPPERCE